VPNVICDPILIRELEVPGSDIRCGVNLIYRPSQEVAALVAALQRELRSIEPGQYYYPTADLHLTVFEISHSLDPQQAAGCSGREASADVPFILTRSSEIELQDWAFGPIQENSGSTLMKADLRFCCFNEVDPLNAKPKACNGPSI